MAVQYRHSALPAKLASRQAGMAYVALLFLLVILVTLGLAFLLKVGTETSAVMNRGANMQAHYLSETAANHAMWRLINEPGWTPDADTYYMHSFAGGRYGYKVRLHTATTFATIATVGAVGENIVKQSYVVYVKPETSEGPAKLYWSEKKTKKIQRSDLDGSNQEDLVANVEEVKLLALDTDGGKMYWADKKAKKICRSDLDGSNAEDLVSGLEEVKGLELDIDAGKIYWADKKADKIQRADLTGSNVEDLVTGIEEFEVFKLDTAGGKMYWADKKADKIQRADLTGSNLEDLVTGVQEVKSIVLDTAAGKMYWADKKADKIQRADLTGSNQEDLVTGIEEIEMLVLDTDAGKMYWADKKADKIQRADLTGSNVEDLVTGVEEVKALVLDTAGGKMYWADKKSQKIQRADLDGSNVEDIVTGVEDVKVLVLSGDEGGIAVRYRAFTEAMADADATSVTISTPVTDAGDLLIVAVATDGDTAGSLAPPGGEGWTLINLGAFSGETTLGIWWKLAGASESATHTFTWTGAHAAYAWMMRFTGHHASNPINASTVGGEGSASPSSTSVTTTVDNALVLRIGAFDDNDITSDDPGLAGHAAITMDSSVSGGLLNGLEGWWKLDDGAGTTAVDSSGNGNDGTLTNMNSGTDWVSGQIDGALEFDGSNDYVTGIGACPTGDFTVACWAKDTAGGDWKVLYSAEQEIWLGVDSGASAVLWMDVGGNNNGVNTSAGTWSMDDTWHHIVGTWDGTAAHIYLDGVDMGLTTFGTPENPQARAAVIGSWSTAPTSETWNGAIDDVRLYNRALSLTEVSALFASAIPCIVYHAFTEVKAASDTTSVSISIPGGTSEGNLLIAAVATDGDTSASLSPPGGEGWNVLDIDDFSNAVTLGAWWKLAGASESATHQFSWSGAEQAYGWMMRFTGHDPANPIDVVDDAGESGANPTSPSVTTTVDDTLVVRLGAFDDSNITVDLPGLGSHTAISMDRSAGTSGQVVFEDFEEAKQSSNVSSITINTPTGTAENDLLIAAVVTDARETLSPPGGEGWTLINQGDGSGAVTLGVWWKLANAPESASHTFTWGSNEEAYGWIMRFTGHDTAVPINASMPQGGNNNSQPPSPAVTSTVTNTMILRIGGYDDDDINTGNPGLSGHTFITVDESGGGGHSCSGSAGYIQQETIGSSGTSSFQLTANEQYRCVTIAIAPAPFVGGGTVSGGAGYVAQPIAGSTGTSNFSLTASEEAKTITLAISPAPPAAPVSGGAGYVTQPSAGVSGTSNFSLTASEEARTVTIAIAPAE